MAFVDSKSWTKQNFKKREIRSKPLELCKTRIKNSSNNMPNFYVVSAGRDMFNDTDRSTTPWSKSRASPLQRKIQKMKVLSKTWVSLNNRLIISDQKLKTFTFGIREQNRGTTKPERQQLKMDLVTRKK